MTRFSIRELMLITVVVAMVIGWTLQATRLQRSNATMQQRLSVLERNEQTRQLILKKMEFMMNARPNLELNSPEEDRWKKERSRKSSPLHSRILEGNRT